MYVCAPADAFGGLVRYVFALFQERLHITKVTEEYEYRNPTQRKDYRSTIPTFLTLYIFGFVYELLLVWDALRLKNTIQIIGLCLYNLGLLIYAAVQMDQINDARNDLQRFPGDSSQGHAIDYTVWPAAKPFLIAIPCIIAFGTLCMAFIARKLYDEFAWTIYKHISADLRMKRRYLAYQVRPSRPLELGRGKLMGFRFTLRCSSLTSSSSSGSRCSSSSSWRAKTRAMSSSVLPSLPYR